MDTEAAKKIAMGIVDKITDDEEGYFKSVAADHAGCTEAGKFTDKGLSETDRIVFRHLARNMLVQHLHSGMSPETQATPEWISMAATLKHVNMLGLMVAVHIAEIRRLQALLAQRGS